MIPFFFILITFDIINQVDQTAMSLLYFCQQLQAIHEESQTELPLSHEEQEEEEYEQEQFKIKIKKKSIDVFAGGQVPIYFQNYLHLFKTIQRTAQRANKTTGILQQLATAITQSMKQSIVQLKVIHRVEERNQWISINEIIQDILPQLTLTQHNFLRELQSQFMEMRRKTITELMALSIKKWQVLVTDLLQKRRTAKQAIDCSVPDWLTLDIVLPTQTKIIQCLQQFQQWRKQHHVAIVWSSQQPLAITGRLSLRLAVEEFGCMIKLRINHRVSKADRLRNIMEVIINPQRNIVFNTFLHVNKHSHNFLITCIKCIHSRLAQKKGQKDIQSILQDIECIDNLDKILEYERGRFNETCIDRCHSQPSRLFAEIQSHFSRVHHTKVEQVSSQVQTDSFNHMFQSIRCAIVETYSQNDINHDPVLSQEDQEQAKHRLGSLTRRSMLIRSSKQHASFIEENEKGEEGREGKKVSFKNLRYKRSNSEKELERLPEQLSPQRSSIDDIKPSKQQQLQNIKTERDCLRHQIQLLKTTQKCNCYIQIGSKNQQIERLSTQLHMANIRINEMNQKFIQISTQQSINITQLHQAKQNADKISKYLRDSDERARNQQSQIETLYSQLQKEKAQQQTCRRECDQLRKMLQQKNDLLTESTIAWRQTQNKLINSIISLQTDKNDLSLKVSQYSHEQKAIKSRLEQQQTQNSSIMFDYAHNEKTLKQQVQQLTSKNYEITAKNEQFSKDLNTLRVINNQLSTKNMENEAKIKTLLQNQSCLKRQIDTLSKQYQQSSEEISMACSEFAFASLISSKRLQYLKIIFSLLLFVTIGTCFTINYMGGHQNDA